MVPSSVVKLLCFGVLGDSSKVDMFCTWLFNTIHFGVLMNITPDFPFLNIHNPFTNERISVYLDKHSRMSLVTKDYFVKQISQLSKAMVIVASA